MRSASLMKLRSNPSPRWPALLLAIWTGLIVSVLGFILFALLHYAWSGELLGFLPFDWRSALEARLGIGQPAEGEAHTWQLRYRSLGSTWMWLLAVAAAVGLTLWTCLQGPSRFGLGGRLWLAGLRLATLSTLLALMLPEWVLSIQGYGQPAVTVVLDDSLSMQAGDTTAGQTGPSRLEAAQRHVQEEILGELLGERRHRVRLYRLGEAAQFVGEFGPEEEAEARAAVGALRAGGQASRLGNGLKQICGEGRTTAVLFWTDGIVTEGEPLRDAAMLAKQRGTPLFFIGVGNPGSLRSLRLHDLQVSDTVHVHDTLVFEARLTAEGYRDSDRPPSVRVQLREKGRDTPLEEQSVTPNPGGQPVQFRLSHPPTEPGDKTFVLEIHPADGPSPNSQARLERQVSVLPIKHLKILYVESYPRYEYRFLKTLLEGQTDPINQAKIIELQTLLLEDALADQSIRMALPPVQELRTYDVVILGDVNPELLRPGDLVNLRDYVRVHGGGFLAIAGERHLPHAYRNTPVADILPIEMKEAPAGPLKVQPERYALAFPAGARLHAIFGSTFAVPPLPEWGEGFTWAADAYGARAEADVLAVHPHRLIRDLPAQVLDRRQPLILDWLPGAGRSMFFGFDETWRWRAFGGEDSHARFWLHVLRYLARVRQGQVTMALDRAGGYRQGESVRVLVRFPEEMRAIPDADRVAVVQRTGRDQTVDLRSRPLQRVPDARGLYELKLDDAEEGSYRVWLSSPVVAPRPSVDFEVLGPPGERDRLLMDQEELQAAATASGGHFYSLGVTAELLANLPRGKEVPLGPIREISLWDHPLIWGLALLLLASEWIARRGKGML